MHIRVILITSTVPVVFWAKGILSRASARASAEGCHTRAFEGKFEFAGWSIIQTCMEMGARMGTLIHLC